MYHVYTYRLVHSGGSLSSVWDGKAKDWKLIMTEASRFSSTWQGGNAYMFIYIYIYIYI